MESIIQDYCQGLIADGEDGSHWVIVDDRGWNLVIWKRNWTFNFLNPKSVLTTQSLSLRIPNMLSPSYRYFQFSDNIPFFLIFHKIKSRFGDCQFNSEEDLECYHEYDYQYCCEDVVAWSNKIWCRYFITDWFHFMLIQFFI